MATKKEQQQKRPAMEGFVPVTAYLPKATADQIEDLCKEDDRTRSQMVRRLLEEAIEARKLVTTK